MRPRSACRLGRRVGAASSPLQRARIALSSLSSVLNSVDHLADALAGKILEIAGLEYECTTCSLDVLRQRALVIALQRGGERLGVVIDAFGGFENVLRRLVHALDRGAEFAGRARQAALLRRRR